MALSTEATSAMIGASFTFAEAQCQQLNRRKLSSGMITYSPSISRQDTKSLWLLQGRSFTGQGCDQAAFSFSPLVRLATPLLSLAWFTAWRHSLLAPRTRCIRFAGGAWLQQNSTQASSLQLAPSALKIEPPSYKPPGKNTGKDALQGDWLALFRSSAPYIAMFRHSMMVFHIPAWLLRSESAAELEGLMGDIALCKLLGVQPVLVLGLEQQQPQHASKAQDELGKRGSKGSRRDMARSILKQQAGEAFFEIERIFNRLAQAMIQLTGGHDCFRSSFPVLATSQLVLALKLPDGKSGVEGRIHSVDADQIRKRLSAGDIVCVTSLCTSGKGTAYYVPSEEVATTIAMKLQATKLIFFGHGDKLVDVRSGRVVATMQLKDARCLLDYVSTPDGQSFRNDPQATELLTNLESSVRALQSGTRRAHFIDARPGDLLQELFTTDGSGMMVSQDLYDGIRLAVASDVSAILELTEPLVARGLLRRRSGYEVECACSRGEFFVWSRDDAIIGCALMEPFEDAKDWAELGCFVVSPTRRRAGYGAVLLSYMEQVATLSGVRRLFLLTTQTMAWFVERGFKEASVSILPGSKQAKYDAGRASKVYVKALDEISSDMQQRFTFVEVDGL